MIYESGQKYNNLMVHENNFKNIFAKNPKCLSLSILIKAKYGSSVVYGKSFKHIANKLKISISRLMECLDDECAKTLFDVNVKNSNNLNDRLISIKANKLYAVGKNIRVQIGGDEFFDTRRMIIGLGENVTLKKITDKLDMIQAVLLVHRQQCAVYSSYGAVDSRITQSKGDAGAEGNNREEDTMNCVFTGCSMETMSRKLGLTKYKTRTVLKRAAKMGAISTRTRKIVYQGNPTHVNGSVQQREGAKFVITYENGKTMEQLSNEYHTTHIRFKNIKKPGKRKDGDGNLINVLRKRRSGTKSGLKNFYIPNKVKLDKDLVWKPEKDLSIPDIVNGEIVRSKTIDGCPSYIRTDLTKEYIKSLKKSKKSDIRAIAKEMLNNFDDEDVMLPYGKDASREWKWRYIKMCVSIKKTAIRYHFSKRTKSDEESYKAASQWLLEDGTYRIHELVSFVQELRRFQRIENNKLKKEKGKYLYLLNDRLVRHVVIDIMKYDVDSVKIDPASRAIFYEFSKIYKFEKNESNRLMWIENTIGGSAELREKMELQGLLDRRMYLGKSFTLSMDAIWYFLSTNRFVEVTGEGEEVESDIMTLEKYIYTKKQELEECSKTVNVRDYMKIESDKRIDDVIGYCG